MIELVITPKHKAADTAKSFGATHVISISSPGDTLPEFGTIHPDNLIKKYFFDICFEPASDIDKIRYFAPPSREIVNDLLRFGTTLNHDSKLLSHCWAGISRSSASAIIAMIPLIGYEEAVAKVATLRVPQSGIIGREDCFEAGRDWFLPNVLLIKYADQFLGLNGQLESLVADSFKY